MTRVSFYILGPNGDKAVEACRLIDKVFRLGHPAYVLTADAGEAGRLDDLLWTYSAGSFVPHAVYRGDDQADAPPVLIGAGEPPAQLHQVLITLAPQVPEWFSRFERVADLVGPDDPDKRQGRERFRFYRERGYELETHNL